MMTHSINGMADDTDVDGKGESLHAALLSYAADCRRMAGDYQHTVDELIREALRAEKAAAAIEEPTPPTEAVPPAV